MGTNRRRLGGVDAWAPGVAPSREVPAVVAMPGGPLLPRPESAPAARGRAGVLAAVLILHGALIAALLLLHGRTRGPVVVPPIQVSIINDAPHRKVPAVSRPELERTPLTVAMPEVPSAAPAPEAPAAVVAAPSVPAQVVPPEKAAPAEPLTPPRFDAAYLKNPPPAYPPASRRLREQGTVVMRVQVSAQGTAGEVSIETSSGSPRLDEAAMSAVRHWRFVPAHRGTQPVEAWVLVPMGFELQR